MTSHTVAGQLGRSVTVDLCDPCQSIWFDPRESLQLTPGATLMLFRLIGEHVAKPHALASDIGQVPALPVAPAAHAGHAAQRPGSNTSAARTTTAG